MFIFDTAYTRWDLDYLYDLLSDLSRLVYVQSVFSVSNNRVQSPPFAETEEREDVVKMKTCIELNRSVWAMRLIRLLLPGDDSQVGRSHAGAHKEDHVLMPGLPVVHDLLLKELQMVLVVPVDLQESDGHLAMPPALVHFAPAALDEQPTH